MAAKIKERVSRALHASHDGLIGHTSGGSNVGDFLYDIFYWQEVGEVADAALKRAWAAAQGDDGPLDADDDLRGLGAGEHIVTESERFSCLVTVQEPRMNFNREAFVAAICKAFKLKREAVDKVAEASKVPTKAPLTRRVVEA